ncbi:MAG TPA: VOC family protein [Bryobacteraceae bacterium]|nr:VOC family protein [Bryobacteraceae bacterium]
MPQLTGILETALDVDDLQVSADFYHRVLGLEIIERSERLCAFAIAGRDVLIVFQREEAAMMRDTAGGRIPPHGSSGSIHYAFSVERAELPYWERLLAANGIAVEGRVNWERGGTSLYFRDPDKHLVELATPGTWAIY